MAQRQRPALMASRLLLFGALGAALIVGACAPVPLTATPTSAPEPASTATATPSPTLAPTPAPTATPMPPEPTPTPTPTATPAPQTHQVEIRDFVLPTITVRIGDTVTCTNRDGVPHTTTSGSNGVFDGVGWNSPFLSLGQAFSHTFTATGVFPYTCRVHPSLNGTVTVTVTT